MNKYCYIFKDDSVVEITADCASDADAIIDQRYNRKDIIRRCYAPEGLMERFFQNVFQRKARV